LRGATYLTQIKVSSNELEKAVWRSLCNVQDREARSPINESASSLTEAIDTYIDTLTLCTNTKYSLFGCQLIQTSSQVGFVNCGVSIHEIRIAIPLLRFVFLQMHGSHVNCIGTCFT
jgi:hypothetical protein